MFLLKFKCINKIEFTKYDQVFIKSSSNKILHAHDNSYRTAYVTEKPKKNILIQDPFY